MSVWSRLRQRNAARHERRRRREVAYTGRHRGAPSIAIAADYRPGRHTALYLQSPEHKKHDIRKRFAETARLFEVLDRFVQAPCPHPSFDRPAPTSSEPITRVDFVPVRPMHFSYSRVVEPRR